MAVAQAEAAACEVRTGTAAAIVPERCPIDESQGPQPLEADRRIDFQRTGNALVRRADIFIKAPNFSQPMRS